MAAYYSEFDPYAAEWLRNLIKAGHIARGDVDERDLWDVKPDDLRGYRQVHLCAGIGIWSLALRECGWEDDEFVWTASFPCQPFSTAGKGLGSADPRHLWPAGYYLIQQLRPSTILGEQVSSKDGLGWFEGVQADLEKEGYAVGGIDTCAAGFGSLCVRQRIYWGASSSDCQRVSGPLKPISPGPSGQRWPGCAEDMCAVIDSPFASIDGNSQPLLRKADDGYSTSMGRLRAYGNSLDLSQAKAFISAWMECAP